MLILALATALSVGPGSFDRAAWSPPSPAVTPVSSPAPQEPAPVLAGVAVTLECTAFKDGRVGDCHVLGETHPGMGFGQAAIALMDGVEAEPGPADIQFARTIQFTP